MQHFMKGTSKPSFSPRLSSPCFLPHRCKLQFSPRGSRKCYTLYWCACSQYTRRGFIVFMYDISERMRGCLPVMCVCVHVMERCRRMIVLWFCFFSRRGGGFLHSYKRGRRGGKCSCSWSKKGKASPGDRALSLCECVCMCLNVYVCLLGSFSTISLHSTHPGDSGASHQMHSSIIHHRNTECVRVIGGSCVRMLRTFLHVCEWFYWRRFVLYSVGVQMLVLLNYTQTQMHTDTDSRWGGVYVCLCVSRTLVYTMTYITCL